MLRLLSIICTALCRKKVHCDTLFSSIWTNINVENKFSKCRQNLIPTRQKWRNKRVSVASNRRISLGCLVWMTVQCCKYTVEIYLFIYLKVRFFLSLIGIHRQEGWISTLIPMSINGTVCIHSDIKYFGLHYFWQVAVTLRVACFAHKRTQIILCHY